MREVSNQLPTKPNITSHSFRIGYITQLWKDSKDIEFVKQTIGHRKLDTTSAYVNKLSDQERQERINEFIYLTDRNLLLNGQFKNQLVIEKVILIYLEIQNIQ
jgi:site-specific recombinase XerD